MSEDDYEKWASKPISWKPLMAISVPIELEDAVKKMAKNTNISCATNVRTASHLLVVFRAEKSELQDIINLIATYNAITFGTINQ